MRTTLHTFINWFFKDNQGNWAIIQTPNLLLTAWLLLSVLLFFTDNTQLEQKIFLLRSAVLFTWSYLEITSGKSKFRKVLSVVVLMFVVKGIFRN